MGLFDEQRGRVEAFRAAKRASAEVREFQAGDLPAWPRGASLILEEDAALELGRPDDGSVFFLLWSERDDVTDGRISLVGPDVGEMQKERVPLGLVLTASGAFVNEYDCYREIRDAVYRTELAGFMVRTLPSRQSMWCRVDREALAGGFSLRHLAAALIAALREAPFVTGAEALVVTSGKDDLAGLEQAASETLQIVSAMIKMNEEMDFDCESCEFFEVCRTVEELRGIRKRLLERRAP